MTNEKIENSLQPIEEIGKLFLQKYTVTKDASKNVYLYNDKYWQEVSPDYLQSLAINFESSLHTSFVRRRAIVNYVLDVSYQSIIVWNQIEKEDITFSNGVHNIVTKKLRNHRRGDYLTSIIPHSYNRQATCPLWEKCLNDWFETDTKKLILQEFFGYLLCSHANYKKALLLTGPSNTSKSLITLIAKFMVGEEFTCHIRPEDMDDFSLASIKNKKLNLVTDLSHVDQLSDGGFKQVISGEPIQIDRQYTGFETIVPVAKHIFATNKIPKIKDVIDGAYSRLMIMGVNKPISKVNQDFDLQEKLKLEIEGIIVWAVEGLKRLTMNNGRFTEIN